MGYAFQKLTPASDADINNYEKALEFIFRENELKNVAISGSYGAGKSSIIESYKEKHKDVKFLHVSLARFKNLAGQVNINTETSSDSLEEKLLEGKVINQLIHQIDMDNIPLTNFQIKREFSHSFVGWVSFLVILWSVLLFYIMNFDSWKSYLSNAGDVLESYLQFTLNDWAPFVAGVVDILIAWFALYRVILYQQRKGWIRKVNIADNEIELFDEQEESLFDRYLDEVLYIFRNANVDVIVFEDIDRYESTHIFQQLREINRLVNIKKEQDSTKTRLRNRVYKFVPLDGVREILLNMVDSLDDTRPLKFFYLLKDDIFTSKDRTKFFDYILPVVPVLDGSNSYDKMIDIFSSMPSWKSFDSQFLQEVSFYIDDMRLLKNIANEFFVYSNNIITTEQDLNKLLAMIIYKNIFPRDFSDLQLSRGYVYNLFAQKEKFVIEEATRINHEIEKLKRENEEIDNIWQESEHEIIDYYNYRKKQVSYHQWDQIEKEESKKVELQKAKGEGKKEKNLVKIQELEFVKSNLSSLPLKQIINRENNDNIFSVEYINAIDEKDNFEDIKGDLYFPLIQYLIRNGYIDETYADYMTYFYENSICRGDKIFLRSITDQKKKDFTYALKEPNKIVASMSNRQYQQEESLNFDLLDYLLKHNDESNNKEHIYDILKQIIDHRNKAFIFQYLSRNKNIELFVDHLNTQWKTIMEYICPDTTIPSKEKEKYILETLRVASDEELSALNMNDVLTRYISGNTSFVEIDDKDCNSIAKKMGTISVRFRTINLDTANDKMLECVYKQNLYELTFSNICRMLKKFYDISSEEKLRHSNFTCIMSKAQDALATYITENMDIYMDVVLENCQEHISDDSSAICFILNNDDIEPTKKVGYISYLDSKVEQLESVSEKSLWTNLLQCDAVVYSADNVLKYFFESSNEKRAELFDFLNTHLNEVIEDDWKHRITSLDKEQQIKLFNSIVPANQLDNHVYKYILESLNRYYKQFSQTGIATDKLEMLMEMQVIRMTDDTLDFIRNEYNSSIIRFICINVDAYSEKISENQIRADEIIESIDQNISTDEKLKLLSLIPEVEITLERKNYEESVKEHIIKNNFSPDDLGLLVNEFKGASESLRETIISTFVQYKDTIIENQMKLSSEICLQFLSKLDEDDRWAVFIQSLLVISPRSCVQCLKLFDDNDDARNLEKIFMGKHPKFKKTSRNKSILDIFIEKEWASSIKEDDEYYIAYGKKKDSVISMLEERNLKNL